LQEARRRLRSLLGKVLEGAESIEFRENIRLPEYARAVVRRSREMRLQAEAARREATASLTQAVRVLTDSLRLSRRDVAELLGLSHQRVQQLERATAGKKKPRKPAGS
jgi:transcriptional regulator with XRE-family HTH domain